ncbi:MULTISPECIES: DUF4124 domain-containing protein [unclassified Endozoicomonas]|uniref:DUF4124 domain-containing protein n=1 Tax=unclassified Endozoicomonas TaxID=2644528 RepID=UPI0021475429|nr:MULTISPECIES: DUF4124 domain-containing protein [unclassified Endozoicomonas]
MKRIIVILLLALPLPGQTSEIYRTVDKNGNVTFTDSPGANKKAEPVQLTPITSIPPTQTTGHSTIKVLDDHKEDIYPVFTITRPANDSTVRDNGNFTVEVSLEPRLASGHSLSLSIDGVQQGKPQRKTQFKLKNVDRGTHQLSVAILDRNGKTLKTANSTVHVQRTVFRPPVPVPAPAL